jgi:hypothetical protein
MIMVKYQTLNYTSFTNQQTGTTFNPRSTLKNLKPQKLLQISTQIIIIIPAIRRRSYKKLPIRLVLGVQFHAG